MNVTDDTGDIERSIIIEAPQSECETLAQVLRDDGNTRWAQLIAVLTRRP